MPRIDHNEYTTRRLTVMMKSEKSRLLRNETTRKSGWVALADIIEAKRIGIDVYEVTAQRWVFERVGIL